jgi:hypothetical protein
VPNESLCAHFILALHRFKHDFGITTSVGMSCQTFFIIHQLPNELIILKENNNRNVVDYTLLNILTKRIQVVCLPLYFVEQHNSLDMGY